MGDRSSDAEMTVNRAMRTNSFCGELFDLSDSDRELIAQLTVPVPENENERIKVLRQARLLDTDTADPTFDRFTSLTARLFEAPVALVSLVDVNRQWFKSKVGKGLFALSGHDFCNPCCLLGFGGTQGDRNHAFCSYTVLPQSSEVFVVEDALADPVFASNPFVTGPPHVSFYAGAALVVEGVRVGSLCIVDFKPRKFSTKDRMNLLDLGSAVAELILERRRTFMNNNQERSAMMLSMMQGLRTPLFAVDLGMSVLNSEKEVVRKFLESAEFPSGKVFCSTIDDMSSSIQKLKMAVESTVVLGRAFAIAPVIARQASMVVPQTLMSDAVMLDIDACMSQMKMVATIIGGKRVEWNCHPFQSSMLELLADKRVSVKSFPDGVNFVILTVLNHILAYDLSQHPISVEVACVKCSGHETTDDSYCHICTSSSSTVKEAHGNITVTIKSRSLKLLDGNAETMNNCETENPELSLGELTLQNIVDKVLHSVGGRFKVSTVSSVNDAAQSQRRQIYDTFICELPYLVCTNEFIPNGNMNASDTPVEAVASVRVGIESVEQSTIVDQFEGAGLTAPQSESLFLNLKQESLGPFSSAPVHVLIVDDSLMIQKMMKKWLEAAGCTVSCAVNGKIGLSMIQANKYDIMLLDFLMPVMLGLETLQQFAAWMKASAANSINKDMLIIGMSSTATEEEQRCGFECGMHFFSPKPVDLESLKRAIAMKKQHSVINECLEIITGELAGTPAVPFKEEIEVALSGRSGAASPTADIGLSKVAARGNSVKTDHAKSKSSRAFGNWSFFRKHSKISPEL
jgi:CheY-like chemotaxis protein